MHNGYKKMEDRFLFGFSVVTMVTMSFLQRFVSECHWSGSGASDADPRIIAVIIIDPAIISGASAHSHAEWLNGVS
jgi:hypothetical protein